MNRQIKFRQPIAQGEKVVDWHYWGFIDGIFIAPVGPFENYNGGNGGTQQYTGHKTIKDKELYEHDIVFVEESQAEVDKRYYLVIVWIPEWSMFASLHVDEYIRWRDEGVKVLDEPLFWTYTLENAEEDFHYAGNIYENSELLKP